MKTLLRCILKNPPKTYVRSYSNFLYCDCCDCNLKQNKKYPQFNIYEYRKEKTIVMSRFRSKIKGLPTVCVTQSKKSLNVFIFVHYGTQNKIVLDLEKTPLSIRSRQEIKKRKYF